MPLTFFTTTRFKLRALKGSNLVSDIDAGFEALANDVDALLYPVGDLRFTARNTLDENWLRCEGQAINRTTFKALFEAIGTAYGEGDKATTFNVPDFRERVPVAVGGALARGATGGEATHKLTEAEMPAHTHEEFIGTGGGPATQKPSSGEHTGVSTGNTATGSAGGGGAHNNMQPYVVCNVWIRAT
jgi:microcystin-dependent protein